jgi:hypothetical protein
MRKWIQLLCIPVVAGLAWCAPEAVLLVALQREGVEGMVWDFSSVSIGKQSYQTSLQGIGSPGAALIVYKIDGKWETFESYIGYTKTQSSSRRCKFEVGADQQTLYTSEVIKGGQEAELIRVPIKGRNLLMLKIEAVSYDGTLGACFAAPKLRNGIPPEEQQMPYRIEINGSRLPYERFAAPSSVPVELPVKPGESTYQVKVIHDQENRRIQVQTTP